MEAFSVYKDMQSRTNGEIYIGVVGPVRTGKSTFIKKFMDTTVIPNIEDEAARDRAVDELPQSASGRTIMTTEPKFIPEQAVTVKMDDTAEFKVRLIDCVGFIVPSASVHRRGAARAWCAHRGLRTPSRSIWRRRSVRRR